MKKSVVGLLLAGTLLAAAFAVGISGCQKKEVRENHFVVSTDTVFAPFVFQNAQGDFVGIDIGILSAVAEDQGFTFELMSVGFHAALAAVEAGQADGVIAGMSITEERRARFDFSQAYFDSGVVMAIGANNFSITSYDDLRGNTVAVKTGTEGSRFAESIQGRYGFELVYFDESPFMYEAVMAGHAVALFEDYPVVTFGIRQGNGLKVVTPMERGSSFGFAVRRGQNAELLRMFDAGLANIRANGVYQTILDTYISTN